MSQMLFDAPELKQIFKQALTETMNEQRDWLREVVVEALEDLALAEAIRQEEGGEPIDRAEVFALLEQAP